MRRHGRLGAADARKGTAAVVARVGRGRRAEREVFRAARW
jgi:hypothetical protein